MSLIIDRRLPRAAAREREALLPAEGSIGRCVPRASSIASPSYASRSASARSQGAARSASCIDRRASSSGSGRAPDQRGAPGLASYCSTAVSATPPCAGEIDEAQHFPAALRIGERRPSGVVVAHAPAATLLRIERLDCRGVLGEDVREHHVMRVPWPETHEVSWNRARSKHLVQGGEERLSVDVVAPRELSLDLAPDPGEAEDAPVIALQPVPVAFDVEILERRTDHRHELQDEAFVVVRVVDALGVHLRDAILTDEIEEPLEGVFGSTLVALLSHEERPVVELNLDADLLLQVVGLGLGQRVCAPVGPVSYDVQAAPVGLRHDVTMEQREHARAEVVSKDDLAVGTGDLQRPEASILRRQLVRAVRENTEIGAEAYSELRALAGNCEAARDRKQIPDRSGAWIGDVPPVVDV